MLADERVTVGLVRGLHGLRGAVRVEVLSDDPERFAVGAVLFVEGDERPLTITWNGPAKPGLLLQFAEVQTRESAESLRDHYLEVIPTAPLPAGSYYWHQIRDLEVTTTQGEVLGRVVDVFRAGAGEVYVVEGPRGEVLLPAVKDVIVELDPPAGRLVVDTIALDLPARPPRRRRRHEISRQDRKAARKRPRRARVAPDTGTPRAAAPEAAKPVGPMHSGTDVDT